MKWYYVENGQQAGPVEETQLPGLMQSGRLLGETLVWHEGMAAWQPFSTVCPPQYATPGTAPLPGTSPAEGEATDAVCVECNNIFRKEDMIRHKDVYVCANCKPVFMQKLGEGISFVRAGSANLTEQQILEREYTIDIGNAISRGWDIFKNNVGLTIGTVVVVGLISFGCSMVGGIFSILFPFANYFVSVLYAPPLAAGVLWLFLRLARGEQAGLGDVFAGFRSKYGQLLMFGLVQLLFNIVCWLPVIAVAIGFGVTKSFKLGSPLPNLETGAAIGLGLTGLIALCGTTYVTTIFEFSMLLIVDKGYRFWPAMQLSRKMVGRRWWMTFLFLLIAGLFLFAGFIVCCFGLLVATPIYFGMKAVFYDDNFRDLLPQQ